MKVLRGVTVPDWSLQNTPLGLRLPKRSLKIEELLSLNFAMLFKTHNVSKDLNITCNYDGNCHLQMKSIVFFVC